MPARDVHYVRDDRRRGRAGARSGTDQDGGRHEVALGDDGVQPPFDAADRGVAANHAGVDALLDPVRRAPCDGEQFDPVAEFLGEPDVEGGDVADTLGVHSIRTEEPTTELQSLMRIPYAVFCV